MSLKRIEFNKACLELKKNRGEAMSNNAYIAFYYYQMAVHKLGYNETEAEYRKEAFKNYKEAVKKLNK